MNTDQTSHSSTETTPDASPAVQRTNKIVLLFLAMLLAAAVTTLLTFKSQRKDLADNSALTSYRTTITATDSTGTFSFSHPDNWVNEKYTWVSCCEGPEKQEPDWKIESKPITLFLNGNEKVKVTMVRQPYSDYLYSSFEDIKKSVQQDYFAQISFEGTLDTGQKALYTQVNYLGPPDAKVESFTDYRRYYDLGDSYLFVEFREKFHHDWYDEQELDNSAYTSDYETIVSSIKFLK